TYRNNLGRVWVSHLAMHDTQDQPHVKNVRLVEKTKSQAGVTGFNMHYGLVLAIATLITLYAAASVFFN
ncbi:MAG: hypothetical protein WB048_17240, partial [Pseudolabrys sp.]